MNVFGGVRMHPSLVFLAEDTAGGGDEARGRGTGATVGGQGGGH